MVGNYRPFGDHLPINDIKKFWSVFGRNLVGKLIFKYFFCHFEFDILLLNIYIYIYIYIYILILRNKRKVQKCMHII